MVPYTFIPSYLSIYYITQLYLSVIRLATMAVSISKYCIDFAPFSAVTVYCGILYHMTWSVVPLKRGYVLPSFDWWQKLTLVNIQINKFCSFFSCNCNIIPFISTTWYVSLKTEYIHTIHVRWYSQVWQNVALFFLFVSCRHLISVT